MYVYVLPCNNSKTIEPLVASFGRHDDPEEPCYRIESGDQKVEGHTGCKRLNASLCRTLPVFTSWCSDMLMAACCGSL